MTARNLGQYWKQGYAQKGLFVYKGTAALKKGHGMCFDLDYLTTETGETATDSFGARGMKVIEKPSASNNMAFAGVLTQDYPARANGDQQVELYLPGSVCPIAGIIPTTINSTRLTCIAASALQVTNETTGHAGYFDEAGYGGRGTAIALQTQTNADGTPWTGSIDGSVSYATATGTLTDDDSDGTLFANAAAGDKVIVLAGGVANAAKAGVYFIKSVTSDDAAIISETDGGDAFLTLAANGAHIAIRVVPAGEPLTLALLCDGEESGLTEYDVAVSAAVTNPMVGGYTNLVGDVTIAADHVPPLADGLFKGMQKSVKLHGALGTGNYLITPASLGLALDNTALVTAELDGDGDEVDFRWNGQAWDVVTVVGTALA